MESCDLQGTQAGELPAGLAVSRVFFDSFTLEICSRDNRRTRFDEKTFFLVSSVCAEPTTQTWDLEVLLAHKTESEGLRTPRCLEIEGHGTLHRGQ